MPSREDGHLQWNGNCLWYEHHPFSCNNLLNQISGWGSTEAIERPVEQRQFVPALHTPHRSTLMVSVSEINRSVWSKIPDVGEFRFMTEHLEAIVPHCEGRA